jgi:hypothetical protein
LKVTMNLAWSFGDESGLVDFAARWGHILHGGVGERQYKMTNMTHIFIMLLLLRTLIFTTAFSYSA